MSLIEIVLMGTILALLNLGIRAMAKGWPRWMQSRFASKTSEARVNRIFVTAFTAAEVLAFLYVVLVRFL